MKGLLKFKDLLLLVATSSTLVSCAQLTIKDFTACAVAPGQVGALCDGYLTNHQTILDQSEWLALSSTGWLCVGPDDYGNIKSELEQACSLVKCTYEQKQAMTQFFRKIEAIRKLK